MQRIDELLSLAGAYGDAGEPDLAIAQVDEAWGLLRDQSDVPAETALEVSTARARILFQAQRWDAAFDVSEGVISTLEGWPASDRERQPLGELLAIRTESLYFLSEYTVSLKSARIFAECFAQGADTLSHSFRLRASVLEARALIKVGEAGNGVEVLLESMRSLALQRKEATEDTAKLAAFEADVHAELVRAYVACGNLDEAAAISMALVERVEDQVPRASESAVADAFFELSNALHESGRFEVARNILEEGLGALAGGSTPYGRGRVTQLRRRLSRVLRELDENEDADLVDAETFRRYRDDADPIPRHQAIQSGTDLARRYFQQGRADQAQPVLTLARDSVVERPDAQELLVDVDLLIVMAAIKVDGAAAGEVAAREFVEHLRPVVNDATRYYFAGGLYEWFYTLADLGRTVEAESAGLELAETLVALKDGPAEVLEVGRMAVDAARRLYEEGHTGEARNVAAVVVRSEVLRAARGDEWLSGAQDILDNTSRRWLRRSRGR